MSDAGPLDYPCDLQSNGLTTQVVEQPDTCAKQDGHQVDVYLV